MKSIKTPLVTTLAIICASLAFASAQAVPAQHATAGGELQIDDNYSGCTGFITSLPATISTAGTWCLNSDLTTDITTGNAVTIATDGVTIDCHGSALEGLGDPAIFIHGVWSYLHNNVVIRRCTIRGFANGVTIFSGSGLIVRDSYFDSNSRVGIIVEGDDRTRVQNFIQGNEVVNTGPNSKFFDVSGIVAGARVRVLDNIVTGIHVSDSQYNKNATGIFAIAAFNAEVTGNLVSGFDQQNTTGRSFGIYSLLSGPISMRYNVVEGDNTAGSVGFYCEEIPGSPFPKVRNNTIDQFETAIVGCEDGGNMAP